MSQNNNNNNNNNCIDLKRDSFSDRICDDLCEVLLSYLSFEDKIRFECVSKQWRKLIFNKQYIIKIYRYPIQKKNIFKALWNERHEFNVKAFESVLKKCKFVNDINFWNNDNNDITYEIILKLIIKYCYYLKSITLCFGLINDKLIEKFGLKFGQKLSHILYYGCSGVQQDIHIHKFKKLLRLCPNLVEINCDLSYFVDENELLVPKLSKIETRF
jgi:hypothetical protein